MWTVGLHNRRNKAAFSNFPGVVWTGPQPAREHEQLEIKKKSYRRTLKPRIASIIP